MINIKQSHSYLSAGNALNLFRIGIALVSFIPALTILYLVTTYHKNGILELHYIIIYITIILIYFIGFILLRNFFSNITVFKDGMVKIIHNEVSANAKNLNITDDISTIENCFDIIIKEFKVKLQALDEEKHRLDNKLYQAEKVESLHVMTARIVHDFNNIFTAILGNIDIITGKHQDHHYLNNIKQIKVSALQALDIINQMLLYIGKVSFDKKEFNLSNIVEQVYNFIKPTIPDSIRIEYQVTDNLPLIFGDTAQIGKVVENLLDNAIDSLEGNCGIITIRTGVELCKHNTFKDAFLIENITDQQYVYIEVSDTGCGISQEIRSRIFDPFFTTKIRRMGMGLSEITGIAKNHKGVIRILTKKEKGCTFKIMFPAKSTG